MLNIKKYDIVPTKKFLKDFNKLSDIHKNMVLDTLEILKLVPFYPSLRTKKIKNNYESSVNMDIRIIWHFKGAQIIVLLDVGHHDVLKKY